VSSSPPGPKVSHVFVWEDGKEEREKYSFKVDDPFRQGKDEFNEYLVSLRLPAGKYMLREISRRRSASARVRTSCVPDRSSR